MRVGDTVDVTVAGQVVAKAKIQEVLSDRATLVIPATVVVMGIRTDFDTPVDQVSETETQIVGTTGNAAPVIEEPVIQPPAQVAPEQATESAPPVATETAHEVEGAQETTSE